MRYSQEASSSFAGVFLIFSLAIVLLAGYFEPQLLKPKKVLGASDQVDPRVELLASFLKSKKSPLASQAGVFIEVADRYGLDWRLLPAIAGKESSFGKVIPWNKKTGRPSYNAWGWGVYGEKVLSFSTWEEGIEKVGEGLRNGYIDKGLLTLGQIMRFYTPRSDGSWARDVSFTMEQIAPLEQEYEQN